MVGHFAKNKKKKSEHFSKYDAVTSRTISLSLKKSSLVLNQIEMSAEKIAKERKKTCEKKERKKTLIAVNHQ